MKYITAPIFDYINKIENWDPKSIGIDTFKYIDLSSVDKDLKEVIPESVPVIPGVKAPSRARQLVRTGDVLVSTVRPNLNGVAIIEKDMDGATASTGYCVLRPIKEQLNSRYLFHWVRTPLFIEKMVNQATGANYPAVSDKIVKNSKIPLPSITDQIRIANILDKADSLRRKRQQALRNADDLLRAIFLDMFGDPVANRKGTEELRIDSFCEIVRGSSPRPKGDPRYYGGSVPRLMVQDLTRDGWYVTPKIDTLTAEGAKKSRPINAGTVVMAVSGNVGLTSILNVDACIHDGFVAFKSLDVTKVLPEFLLFMMTFLKSTHASREAGAIFKNLTTSQIKEMQIPVPSIMAQTQFVSVLKKQKIIRNLLSNNLTHTDLLKNSLCAKAFSGEL